LKHFYKYLAGLFLIALACDSDEPKQADIGLDYFPLRTGFYQIYDVDETQYSEVSEPVHLQYEIMTEVIDSFPNTAGNFTYVIHRNKRENETADWQFLDSWSARIDDTEVIQNEGNTPYLKLILPVKNNITWDGNKYNDKGEDVYMLSRVDESYVVGDTTYTKTLMVEQEKNEDPIVFRDIRKEYYARHAGLIYRETTQLNYCTDADKGCLGKQEIESGIVYIQQIKEYGIQ
jgi:hypothetical protein